MKFRIRLKSFFLYVFLLFFFFDLSNAYAEKNSFRLIFFGDSLVDVGNDPIITNIISTQPNGDLSVGLVIPPPTRYDRGRFSNGPVLSDYLAARLGIILKPSLTGFDLQTDSVSYAYGGSKTGIQDLTPGGFPVPGLLGQVDKFAEDLAQSGANITKITFVVWSGANDYLNALPFGIQPDPYSIADNIEQAVNSLISFGAKRIIVVNLPDLGRVPFCSIFGICDSLTQLTGIHNQLLADRLNGIRSLHRSVKVELFDARSTFDSLLDNPEGFGFTNDPSSGPASGCLFQLPSDFLLENCGLVDFASKNIYWDEVHPSSRVHQLLANKMWSRIFSGPMAKDSYKVGNKNRR